MFLVENMKTKQIKKPFLLCFSTNNREFSVKSKPIFNVSIYDFWIFTVWDYFFLLYFIALNAIWAHCLGAKLRFHPSIIPLTRNG